MCNIFLFKLTGFFIISGEGVASRKGAQPSPDGKQFSITSPDRRIRVFWYRTGKLRRVYDESLEVMVLPEFHPFVAFWTYGK